VRAARYAEVRTRIKGIVEKVWVDEGKPVREGQKLFTINVRAREQQLAEERAASLASEAELKAAQIELQNIQLLADKDIVSKAELELARAKTDMLRAKVKQAKASTTRVAYELDRAVVTAPFAGVNNRIPRKAGTVVEDNELLTTITDSHEVLAYFALAEREYLRYRTQDDAPTNVKLVLADNSAFPHEGRIDSIASELDPQTGTIAFRARFPNDEGMLKHGSSGKVVLTSTLHHALVVPQKSTFEVQGDIYIYVVDAKNIVHARKLTVKERVGDVFVIDDGVTTNDRYVVEGAQKLRDGLAVRVRS
jgi:membrane fusion protein (multidrug efflux system)